MRYALNLVTLRKWSIVRRYNSSSSLGNKLYYGWKRSWKSTRGRKFWFAHAQIDCFARLPSSFPSVVFAEALYIQVTNEDGSIVQDDLGWVILPSSLPSVALLKRPSLVFRTAILHRITSHTRISHVYTKYKVLITCYWMVLQTKKRKGKQKNKTRHMYTWQEPVAIVTQGTYLRFL